MLPTGPTGCPKLVVTAAGQGAAVAVAQESISGQDRTAIGGVVVNWDPNRRVREAPTTGMMSGVMSSPPAPLEGFTDALAFTTQSTSLAPPGAGVHVVFDTDGDPIYVGHTGNLRRRLREHLQGDRQASVLHEQVGTELDRPDHLATAAEIAEWLGRCTVSWRLSDDPQELKAQLVASLHPRFNRAIEQPSSGIWWVNQGRSFEAEQAAGSCSLGVLRPGWRTTSM